MSRPKHCMTFSHDNKFKRQSYFEYEWRVKVERKKTSHTWKQVTCLIALKLLAKNDNIWSPAGAFSLLRRLRCLNSSAQTVELTSIAAEGEPLYFTKKKVIEFLQCKLNWNPHNKKKKKCKPEQTYKVSNVGFLRWRRRQRSPHVIVLIDVQSISFCGFLFESCFNVTRRFSRAAKML